MKKKKIRRMSAVILSLILIMGQTWWASAGSYSYKIDGISYRVYSTCTGSRISAGTTSSNSSFLGRVASSYVYTYSSSGISKTGTKTVSGYGTQAAFTINATGSKEYTQISSDHMAAYNSQKASSYTSAFK